MDDAQSARLMATDPRTLGYRFTIWTAPLLASQLCQTYGCVLSERTLRRRLRQHGWRWKRPRHIDHERAEHVAQKRGDCPPPYARDEL